MRISDWSSDVCSSDLFVAADRTAAAGVEATGSGQGFGLLADDGADLGTAGQHEALSLFDRMVSRTAGGAGEKEQVFAAEARSGRQREQQARALVRVERIVGGVAACRHRQAAKLERALPFAGVRLLVDDLVGERSEEHTSELQSLMRISSAVFCWQQ